MTDDRTPPSPAEGPAAPGEAAASRSGREQRQATGDRGGDGTGSGASGGATAAEDGPDAPRPPLVRSDRHRVVAGVCGGLGRHLDIDPVVFRVVVAVLCLSGGLGLFLYGLAWLIVPAEGSRKTEIQRVLTGQVDAQSIGAVLLTVIGTGVFFSWMDRGDHLFPLLLLGVLIFFAVRYDPERRGHREGGRQSRRSQGPYDRHLDREEMRAWRQEWHAQWRQQRQQFRDEWAVRREEVRRAAQSPTGYRWDPRHPERNPYAPHDAPPPTAAAPAWWQREDLPAGDPLRKPGAGPSTAPPAGPSAGPEPDAPCLMRPSRHHPWQHPPYQRERSFLGPVALLLSLGAGAAVWAASGGQNGEVRLTTVLAAVLLVQGLALLIATRWGRVRGLVLPALLTTLALAAAGTVDLPIRASVGERIWVPADVSQVERTYSLGAGNARLDLSRIDPAGATVATSVRLGAGDLTVTVPNNVTLRVVVHSAAGEVQLPGGDRIGGVGTEHRANLPPLGGAESKGTITLDLKVGLGDVRVVRQ
ncbi:PspC domain-containing protein [Peterkaempfera bronchialis]|uniref:PspC domain-containing protein n=1 Tax=Peterkaempfera bronchialis TaxID=2126346 RepID=UPI003C2DB8B5